MVSLKGFEDGIPLCSNDYLFSLNEKGFFNGLIKDSQVDLNYRVNQTYENTVIMELENCGTDTALFVCIESNFPEVKMFSPQNFSCLLPGDKMEYRIDMYGRKDGMDTTLKLSALNMEETMCILLPEFKR